MAQLLVGLTYIYARLGRYAAAESSCLRALRIYEQQVGPEHDKTTKIVHDLLTIHEQALGVQHPKTKETRARFIALLHKLGQHEQAIQLEMIQAQS